jgi:hypothetical protein
MKRRLSVAFLAVVALILGFATPAAAHNTGEQVLFSHRCAAIGDDGTRQAVICSEIWIQVTGGPFETTKVYAKAVGQAFCQNKATGTLLTCAGTKFTAGLYKQPGSVQIIRKDTSCGSYSVPAGSCPIGARFIDGTPYAFIGTIPSKAPFISCLDVDLWTSITTPVIKVMATNTVFNGANVASLHTAHVCIDFQFNWDVT